MENRNYDQDEILIRQSLENQFPVNFEFSKGADAKMKPRRIFRKSSVVIVAAVLFCLTTATVFAASGELGHFLSRFVNASFIEFAIPPQSPAYAEDQGIKIEAAGAQQIGPVVLLYITMQDTTGENRLTRYMWPDIGIYVGGRLIEEPSSSRMLNFDSDTNTAYFEKLVISEFGMGRADTFELIISQIGCFEHSGQVQTSFEGDWQIKVNTSDSGIHPIIWADVTARNLHFNYIYVTPFGVHMVGTHTYGERPRGSASIFDEVRIEFDNRWFDTRLRSGSFNFGSSRFTAIAFANSPIDIDAVSAVIVHGERFQIP